MGCPVKPKGIPVRSDLKGQQWSARSKYLVACSPVTHTIFHDASAFPALVQVLTKSQLEDVMGGKCVSKRTRLHTVSYKAFSSLLPEFLLQL